MGGQRRRRLIEQRLDLSLNPVTWHIGRMIQVGATHGPESSVLDAPLEQFLIQRHAKAGLLRDDHAAFCVDLTGVLK